MPNFDAVFDKAAWKAAETYGLATPKMRGSLDAEQRLARVLGLREAARTAVVDLQQWQVDDDIQVRATAHDALKSLITNLHTGELSERDTEHQEGRAVDRMVKRVLFRAADPDVPEGRWRDPRTQRRVRMRLIEAALLLSAVTSTLIVLRLQWIALLTLFLGASFDILDGVFARLTRMRDARLRWRSCIFSHLGDLAILCGIGVSVAIADQDDSYAFAVVAAALLSLFGAFVRTSALQAGFRFWRSSLERWVRYAAVIVYCVLAAAGHDDAGALLTASMLALFGMAEVMRVVANVDRMPTVLSGAMYFLDTEHAIHAYPMSDADDDTLWPDSEGDEKSHEPAATSGYPWSRPQ